MCVVIKLCSLQKNEYFYTKTRSQQGSPPDGFMLLVLNENKLHIRDV